MSLIKMVFKSEEQLISHIKEHKPSLYLSSQTSTVIPYQKIEKSLGLKDDQNYYLCDLSLMPKEMSLDENGNLVVKGPVSWKEAKDFLADFGKTIKTAPTEELALINAGLATSCTGERCFSFGNLRSQVLACTYLNYQGKYKTLSRDRKLEVPELDLTEYQKSFLPYQNFKNAPFPRLENETDLMIGTEGQLGVITESIIEVTEDVPIQHLFVLVPKWEDDYTAHLEIFKKIQSFRDDVFICELLDSNSFDYLSEDNRPNQNMDALFFEVKQAEFESFYESFILNLKSIDQEKVFELSSSRFHSLRASVPRAVHEKNSAMNVTKKGTDVQVTDKKFSELLDMYRSFSKSGIRYNLFGHFGDAHLHFNFMPKKDEESKCENLLTDLYEKCFEWHGSPFAEHGIGIIKQKYIKPFLGEVHYSVFKKLKETYDPYRQFFPQGVMNK